jgi:plastocyanin
MGKKEVALVRRIILLITVALALVATLFVVSVAGAQKQPTASPAQKQPTRTVVIKDFRFSPAKITVKPGTRVTWVNKDKAPHTATAKNGTFNSGELRKGQRYSRTFKKAGKKYAYFCELHPFMRGSVTVKPRR